MISGACVSVYLIVIETTLFSAVMEIQKRDTNNTPKKLSDQCQHVFYYIKAH